MKLYRLLLACAFAGSFAAGFASCSEADRHLDCQQICTKFKDCGNSGLDMKECRETCESKADDTPQSDEQADKCENCLDGKSCVGSALGCIAECGPFLPAGTK
jgi:hypothetical protein